MLASMREGVCSSPHDTCRRLLLLLHLGRVHDGYRKNEYDQSPKYVRYFIGAPGARLSLSLKVSPEVSESTGLHTAHLCTLFKLILRQIVPSSNLIVPCMSPLTSNDTVAPLPETGHTRCPAPS